MLQRVLKRQDVNAKFKGLNGKHIIYLLLKLMKLHQLLMIKEYNLF